MKKITEAQFNALTSKRMTTVGSTLSDVIKTAQNNPEHLTDEKFEAIKSYLENAVENVINGLEAAMNQPQISEIGAFKLAGGAGGSSGGGRKSVTRGKKARQLADKLIAQKKAGEAIDPEDYDILPAKLQKEVDAVEMATPAGTKEIEPKVDDDDQGDVAPASDPAAEDAAQTAEQDQDEAEGDEPSDDDLDALLGEDDETASDEAQPEAANDDVADTGGDLSDDELEALLAG